MSEQDYKTKRIHHGRNISRIRKELGIKQQSLAMDMNMNQQTISAYERKRVIEDEMLDKFAEAMNVPVETVKELEEDPVTVLIANNTIENSGNSSKNITGYIENDNSTTTYNHPVDQILKLSKEKQDLYERMVEVEKEKSEFLKKLLKEKNK